MEGGLRVEMRDMASIRIITRSINIVVTSVVQCIYDNISCITLADRKTFKQILIWNNIGQSVCLLICCLTSRSRIFLSNGDVPRAATFRSMIGIYIELSLL